MEENGRISWNGIDDETSINLERFMFELQWDLERLKYLSDADKHLGKKDLKGEGNVVVKALRAVVEDLEKENYAKWRCNLDILQKIKDELVIIADKLDAGEETSSLEFPGIGVAASRYPFKGREKWRQEKEELLEELKDPINNEKGRERVVDVFRGLESIAAQFAPEADWVPPYIVMHSNSGCRRQRMAKFSLAALLEGFLCDPECGDKNFYDFIPDDFREEPSKMPTKESQEVLLTFLREIGAVPNWYTPHCLRDWDADNYNLDASTDEKLMMEDTFNERIGGDQNLRRLREERKQIVAMVR